jgi:hypothetical protein
VCEEAPVRLRMNRCGVPMPVDKPRQNDQQSQRRADVLEDVAPASRSEQRQRNYLAEERPMRVEPISGVSE